MRENQKEELALALKREKLRKRRIEEENAIEEWRNDCSRVQSEMRSVVDSRRITWAKWISIKEDAAKLAHDEVEEELELLKHSDNIRKLEMNKHNQTMEQTAREEQEILSRATQRSQELEEERFKLRETLESARRKQQEKYFKRQNHI